MPATAPSSRKATTETPCVGRVGVSAYAESGGLRPARAVTSSATPAPSMPTTQSSARVRSSSEARPSVQDELSTQSDGSRTASVRSPVAKSADAATAERTTTTATTAYTTSSTGSSGEVAGGAVARPLSWSAQDHHRSRGPSVTLRSRTIHAATTTASAAHSTAPVILAPRVNITPRWSRLNAHGTRAPQTTGSACG
ncbi:hypothetical protein ACFWGI_02825 [Streptomyces niveus]|uniref:hypothetical protein n=1 Tax=Streptomyces niveus TaxID=193462 RepID=UPI00364E7A95